MHALFATELFELMLHAQQDEENEQPANIKKGENTQLYEKNPLSFKSSRNNLNTIKNIKDEHNIQSGNIKINK
ncbi:hypothetical protein PFDG_03756 [Plasmodium falciparum Dd2]|uniref:Uncharacterized protein n=1 Tax=Plasmodium falciparum (isolate Dd2) TaxID=57267 RepID=A0A0L7M431_PLAF4|nr:hypothetical protein PFDG_03756 [Plasmodium falciparum Dd2]